MMNKMGHGLNTAEQRKSLWKDLETLAQGITQSWLIVGDFNAVMYAKDRIVGVPVTSNEIKDFGDCVRDMGLMSCNGMVTTTLGIISNVERVESQVE